MSLIVDWLVNCKLIGSVVLLLGLNLMSFNSNVSELRTYREALSISRALSSEKWNWDL